MKRLLANLDEDNQSCLRTNHLLHLLPNGRDDGSHLEEAFTDSQVSKLAGATDTYGHFLVHTLQSPSVTKHTYKVALFSLVHNLPYTISSVHKKVQKQFYNPRVFLGGRLSYRIFYVYRTFLNKTIQLFLNFD